METFVNVKGSDIHSGEGITGAFFQSHNSPILTAIRLRCYEPNQKSSIQIGDDCRPLLKPGLKVVTCVFTLPERLSMRQ